MPGSVVWFRRDLRLADHEPLHQASQLGAVLPFFILDDALLFHPETAVARVAFLLENLRCLDGELRRRGGRLLVRRGEPAQQLLQLVRASGADRVIAHTDSERLVGRVRDARVNRLMAAEGIPIHWIEPAGACGDLLSHGTWRRQWHGAMAAAPHPEPRQLVVPPASPALPDLPVPQLHDLGLVHDGKPIPRGGTAAARQLLDQFCEGPAARSYFWELSYPSARVTTGLSPYLKFGVISPRECLRRLAPLAGAGDGRLGRSALQLASRLRWAAAITQRFRYLPQLELRSLWRHHDAEPYPFDEELYGAWREGRTGFPIVDAAARCLRAEGGWRELNFRSRAIYASFLANLAGIDWRYGALHFMRHLIDGDCPIDHYQWAMQAGVTSRGQRAWSRIYNPGQLAVDRCDPQGLFIRKWLPELAGLTNDQLGAPPPMADYPPPILDYETARRRRLGALSASRGMEATLLDDLAVLPDDLTPFGSGRFPEAMVEWTRQETSTLFPPPLELGDLDGEQRQALASWFQMGRSDSARTTASRTASPRRRQRSSRESPGQLSLDLEL
ncbi:MAG: deoxyribodipyrimidine photolyase [Synechococcaceae bacterium WB8_1B_136]|nr:deoxyribodipyrimidine photolyase [Synechococcaceae bacterium WB8_1B_136]